MHLSERISDKISKELNLDKDKSEIIAYGSFALLQILLALGLVALFGFLLGVLTQALLASFTASILRQYSGGVHASKSSLCLIIGTAVTIIIALLAKYSSSIISLEMNITIGVLIFVYSFIVIYKRAPVDSAAKPIRTQTKKARMRKISFCILSTYFIIFTVFILFVYFTKEKIYMEYSLSLLGALGWQAFTLTIIGHKVLNKMDDLLNQLIIKERRFKNEKS